MGRYINTSTNDKMYKRRQNEKKEKEIKPVYQTPSPKSNLKAYFESYYPAANPAPKPAASAPRQQRKTSLLQKYRDKAPQKEQPCKSSVH
jgi:hypothetical protein